jgi:hypothetical protein
MRGPAKPPVSATPIRIALAGLMGVILAIIASRAFDALVWPLLAAPLVVTIVGLLSYPRRALERLVALAVGVVVGTVGAGLLAGADATELVTGPVTGFKRLLTTEWPSPRDPTIVVAIALMLSIVTALAVELAGRPRFHLAPLAVIAIGLTGAMAIAAPVHPTLATLVGLGAAALLMTMLRPGDDARARARTLGADRAFVVALAAIIVTGVVTGSAIAWADRADPRSTNEAEAAATLLDPVEEMVALREAEPAFDLFHITDRSTLIGPSLPARWRLSALDVYDGQRWTPGLTLRPIGSTLGAPSPPRPDIPPPIEFEVELMTDDIDLVPIPGRPLSVDTGSEKGVETDLDRTVVRLAEDPRPGLTIDASAETAPVDAVARAATIGTRQVDDVARGFTDVARSLAGDGTVLEQLESIERTMHERWSLDDDAPGSGQQLALLELFVNETERGTQEQFASAFVLMARSLGVNARMATGLLVPPEDLSVSAGSALPLRSTHAAVWPEVEIVGRGWLPFDPAPAAQAASEDAPPPPPAAQSPAAAQPPIAPPAERADDDDTTVVEPESNTSRWVTVQTWARRVGVVGGAALLPFLVAVGAILGTKWTRRRRRLNVQDPARRITGAWANTTDSLVDAGLTIRPAWTNDAIAEEGTRVAPGVPHEMRRLAASATAITFGEESEDWTRVDDALAASRSVDDAILADRTRWQRIRWRLSLRSLRRPTRSPVTA